MSPDNAEDAPKFPAFLFDLLGFLRFEKRKFVVYEQASAISRNSTVKGTVGAFCKRANSNIISIVTAAHVLRRYSDEDTLSVEINGHTYPLDTSSIDNDGDLAIIDVPNNDPPTPNSLNPDFNSLNPEHIVQQPVFRCGVTSGRSQMNLLAVNYVGTIWQGEATRKTTNYIHIAESNSDAECGDSGGPWWQGQSLVGIHWSFGCYKNDDLSDEEEVKIMPPDGHRFHFASSVVLGLEHKTFLVDSIL